jgi:GT2 family glycosyltransferase
MKRRVAAIIVLYKMDAGQSVSYQSLLKAEHAISPDELELLVLLHDNTPGAVAPAGLPANVRFFADPHNNGLASAYNRALAVALDEGYDWLLTLDQDTELPTDTFRLLGEGMAAADEHPEIGAVVPQIRAGGRIVSPNYFAAGALPRWFMPGYTGVPQRAVFAFNSGSLVRTAALRQIGGYSPWFWLDNSDSFLFRELRRFGKQVYIAGNLELNHDFSMLNMQERVSPERYRTILLAESAFWDLNMNGLAGMERTGRLLGRVVKHAIRRDSPELRRLTVQQLGRRLFRSRRYRLKLWRRLTAERLGEAIQTPLRTERPMISVCMAAYNGDRYIEAQLRSILPQLERGDEIVIVDDASRDTTPEVVRRIQKESAEDPAMPRIVLIRHQVNRGVVRTFDEAVRGATGDILFLCDDDDLWASDKVRKVLEVFRTQPATNVVATGLTLIDDRDQPIEGSDFLKHRRRFTAGLAANLLHNQFQGSAMAFRASLVRHILPFPTGRLFLHDAWIGARNTLAGGGTAYIDEPLLLYRRHTGNYSRRFGPWKQVKLRLELLGAHLGQAFHRL